MSANPTFTSSINIFGEVPRHPSENAASEPAMEPASAQVADLELSGVIGFNGRVPHGMLLHPNDQHLIYPLGSTIVVRDLLHNTQSFLQRGGHDREVSCLTLSATGKWLASGQVSHMGFAATVIVWNMETFEVAHRLVLHKGKVQDLAFSPNEKYLATLGGRDDNKIVLWDVETGAAICGAQAANETANVVRFFHHSDYMFVTGGHSNLRVWTFDAQNRKIRPADCQLGQLKRVIQSIAIDEADQFMYCGTASGDLLQVSLGPNLFKAAGPAKKPLQLGITCVLRTKRGNYVVGAGDGTVALIKRDGLTMARRTAVDGAVTSLVLNAAGDHFFVGTNKCNQYLVNCQSFEMELRNTCHSGPVVDAAFPAGFSDLFATCGGSDIRVWNARTRNELLRIQVPNLHCLCVAFSPDGRSIVSGWDDGKIRAFKPQSGKLLYAINDAHLGGVTALACTRDGSRLVSGGEGGQVRVWSVERGVQRMVASMKEHKGRVNCIRLNEDDSECVSASSDGSCIVWNLHRFVRAQCLFASTQFRAVVWHPDGSQLLTTGSDRKLTYWDKSDAAPIRILDGSTSEACTTMDISQDGATFVLGAADKLVKVYAYDEGVLGARGVGHSGPVQRVLLSPDQRTIVSIGDEGAVFLWHAPRFSVDDDGNVHHYDADAEEDEQLQQQFARSGFDERSPYAGQEEKTNGGGYGASGRSAAASSSSRQAPPSQRSAASHRSTASSAAASRRTPGRR